MKLRHQCNILKNIEYVIGVADTPHSDKDA